MVGGSLLLIEILLTPTPPETYDSQSNFGLRPPSALAPLYVPVPTLAPPPTSLHLPTPAPPPTHSMEQKIEETTTEERKKENNKDKILEFRTDPESRLWVDDIKMLPRSDKAMEGGGAGRIRGDVPRTSLAPPPRSGPSPLESLLVVWNAPMHSWSGVASEAVDFLLPLADKLPHLALVGGYDIDFVRDILQNNPDEMTTLTKLRTTADEVPKLMHLIPKSIYITQYAPGTYAQDSMLHNTQDFSYRIGRVMFETTSLPQGWREDMARWMDEIWVPSEWGKTTFIAAGVPSEKLVVMPEGISCQMFDASRRVTPGALKQTSLKKNNSFEFLSIFKFEERKAWDDLIFAFAAEFPNTDHQIPVRLTLRTGSSGQRKEILTKIQDVVGQAVGHNSTAVNQVMKKITLLKHVSQSEYPQLFTNAQAFVLPTHGEGWGRPLMEAMSMGLPVIAPEWSGLTQFMTSNNSILIPVDHLAPAYPTQPELLTDSSRTEVDDQLSKHQWAVIDRSKLRSAMRKVVENPVWAKEVGKLASSDVGRYWCREIISKKVQKRLETLYKSLK